MVKNKLAHVVNQSMNPGGEALLVGHQLALLAPVQLGPAVVDVDVLVAGLQVAIRSQAVSHVLKITARALKKKTFYHVQVFIDAPKGMPLTVDFAVEL